MRTNKVLLILLYLLVLRSTAKTQSLNGVWEGKSEYSILVLNPIRILLELEVVNDTLLSGVLHQYYTKNRFEHVAISGVIRWRDSIVTIIEEKEISHNINEKWFELCLGIMTLKLSKQETSYRMEGQWKDNSKKLFRCPKGSMGFQKNIAEFKFKDQPSKIFGRTTDVQKVVEIDEEEISDSIKCFLYDNGIVDGDTVSVFFNDSLIVENKRVSEKPIEFSLKIDRNKNLQKLKLIAINLGSIPPNTALLYIVTKKSRHEINLSSDLTKNGSVELFLKE